MLPSYNLRRVLLHWFSRPISALAKVVEYGYYITEGAPTAYSNGIRDVVRRIPLTNLLTETDVPTVVKAIAEIKNMDVADVAAQIIKNFEEFFGVKLNQIE